ncbi:MAG TPA: MgtC/SapB family protein [Casimicrobiaceae bacterium]|nr:MgtC/SapB family protein [Casimicrobiaceae bacterium]
MNEWEAIVRTIAALVAGGAIGLERSYHGRAAGLRTYALVSFGSALLVAGGQYELFSSNDSGEVTRIIQGIVTGIGFLGAGVIVKEGFSVRGLTTAASIWCAAAIGVVLGAGSYWMGFASTIVTLVALTILRRIEDRLPSQTFVHFDVGFRRASTMNEERLRELIRQYGFTISEFAYRLDAGSQTLEYRGVMWSNAPSRLHEVERGLLALPDVLHFRMSPARE